MNKVKCLMDFIAKNVLRIAFLIIFIFAFFVKAMYSFDDSPYFALNNWYDAIMALVVVFFFVVIYIKRKWISEHLSYKCCFVFFMACAVSYILLVPLTPFSDMESVYEGAIKFADFRWDEFLEDEYWNYFPGNIKLAVFWGILLIPLPKKLITIKIINAIFVYIIAALTREIAKEYGLKYYNLVYLLMLGFAPLFLYINHVYFDIPVILLCMLAIYIFKKKNNIVLAFTILGLARYVRKSVSIFLLAMIIVYIFQNIDSFSDKRWVKKIGLLLVGILLFFAVEKSTTSLVKNRFIEGNFQSYPGWNQIYIGINEEEFGFMDGDFSYERDAQDVIDRIKEYGPVRFSKIILKKTFWLWSQGTYQAQRYAFGDDVVSWEQKFEYETPLTDFLLNDGQVLRKIINAFMRAQYMVLFGLMIITLLKVKDIDCFRLFYYIIIATFLIMLVYELKSRYILQLLPFMAILAGNTVEIIENSQRKVSVHIDDKL